MKNKVSPVFSILMCVYNHTELLEIAIRSVLDQSEASWELLILDNSDLNKDVSWKILNQFAEQEDRIHIFRNDRNEGWAKGTAQLLKYASGIYMTFLAADDFLLPDVLREVRKETDLEEPDIVWVGNGFYQYTDHKLTKMGQSVLEQKKVLTGKQASHIKNIMEYTFYNSMFHYEKISFLQKNGIDFFEPYYGDCVGMTKAMAEAEKMLILNREVYGLIANTSQTREKYFWDCADYIFISQWNCIKNAYIRDGYFSFKDARFCAIAVLRAVTGSIAALFGGAVCINQEMNPVDKSLEERFRQTEELLQHPAVWEMILLYGRFEYEEEILGLLSIQCAGLECAGEDVSKIRQPQKWLGLLLKQNEMMSCRERMDGFVKILTDENNIGLMGMGVFLQYVNSLSDTEIRSYMDSIQKILQLYDKWKQLFAEKVFSEFQREHKFTGQSKIELAAFCKYILEN